MGKHITEFLIPINIAILTVSDTRTERTDTSGQCLEKCIKDAGHHLTEKRIIVDDIYKIRATTSRWIADDTTHAVLITGGTGFTSRDSTPEAIQPLLDKTVDGFGELFRQISFNQIGTSTIQSRAIAGLANKTIIFCIPGSTNACKTAWDEIIQYQLDSSHGPCNFVPQLKNIDLSSCSSRK